MRNASTLGTVLIGLLCSGGGGLAETSAPPPTCFAWYAQSTPEGVAVMSDKELEDALTISNPDGASSAYRNPLHERYCRSAHKVFVAEYCRRKPTVAWCKV
jgi:hypothetical protein